MPRMARVVIPGIAHHVTQRGNRRQRVFFRKADYRRFLSLLGGYAGQHGLTVRAWCLMSNHVHLVAVPAAADSLSATLRPVHLRYAQEANRRLGVTGYLWQPRRGPCGRAVLLVPAGRAPLLGGRAIRGA